MPFIHDHHLMLQHDNARPRVARICTQLLEAEHIPVLAWPAYSPDTSPIEHVWDALDRQRSGWIISFTNTDLDRFVNNISEK